MCIRTKMQRVSFKVFKMTMTPRRIVQNEFYVCPTTLLKNREPTAWTVKSVRGYQTLLLEKGLQQKSKNIHFATLLRFRFEYNYTDEELKGYVSL